MRSHLGNCLSVATLTILAIFLLPTQAKNVEADDIKDFESSEKSVNQSSTDAKNIPSKVYRCGTILADGKICGGLIGVSKNPIETSKELFTAVGSLPTPYERPNSRQTIFLNGSWGIVANPYSDKVVSTDGQIEIDVIEPDLEISTLNWKSKGKSELKYKVIVDETVVFESSYRTVLQDQHPWLRWTEISDEVKDALESGNSLTVALVNKSAQVVHEDSYELAGFSENLFAIRKLLADAPRVAYED